MSLRLVADIYISNPFPAQHYPWPSLQGKVQCVDQGNGCQHCSKRVTSMAFADDLVLLSGSWERMQSNIKILEAFCDLTGLRTQGQKCHGFYIQPTKRPVRRKCVTFT